MLLLKTVIVQENSITVSLVELSALGPGAALYEAYGGMEEEDNWANSEFP